eukprot:1143803-Pelagomonas_calceolata.AAC.3
MEACPKGAFADTFKEEDSASNDVVPSEKPHSNNTVNCANNSKVTTLLFTRSSWVWVGLSVLPIPWINFILGGGQNIGFRGCVDQVRRRRYSCSVSRACSFAGRLTLGIYQMRRARTGRAYCRSWPRPDTGCPWEATSSDLTREMRCRGRLWCWYYLCWRWIARECSHCVHGFSVLLLGVTEETLKPMLLHFHHGTLGMNTPERRLAQLYPQFPSSCKHGDQLLTLVGMPGAWALGIFVSFPSHVCSHCLHSQLSFLLNYYMTVLESCKNPVQTGNRALKFRA